MINAYDIILALHDGAKAAEGGNTLAGVLHTMADSLAESMTARSRDVVGYRRDELRVILSDGSREA